MKKIALSFLIVLPSLATAQKSVQSTPMVAGASIAVVQTEYGKVRGFIHNGTHTFRGIPYAQAKRFQAPSKPNSWEGIRSSMSYGPLCPTYPPTTTVQDESEFVYHHDWGYASEDCLNLNIWSPGINDGKKRAVMVWLHGGGYTFGSSHELPSLEGESLSQKGDIVVVSVNHRLNIIGFLDLSAFGEKYKHSGNASMLDLVMSLEWIKNNIANFGGDPGNVTIFGQSGGGSKVTTMMSAPSAKGLFHKAIVQSGAGAQFQNKEITKRVGAAVLSELGLTAATVDSIQRIPYDRLSAAGQRALMKVREQLTAEGKSVPFFGFGWAPVQDGEFLPYQSTDKEALAQSSTVPLLIGSTKNEFMASLRTPALRKATKEEAMAHLQKQFGDKTEAYVGALKKVYPTDTRPSDLVDIDVFFRRNVIAQANLKSANGSAPVYTYLFTWQSPIFDGDYKSLHCMELPFVFNNIAKCEEMTGGGVDAYALAHIMSTSWINFAKTGNPNHKNLPPWTPYTDVNGAVMFFDKTCSEKYHPDKEALEIAVSVLPR